MNLLEFKQVIVGDNICVVDEKNTAENYDGRIKKGDHFYKSDLNDIVVAEYSPASNVSFPILASTSPLANLPRLIIKEYCELLAEERFIVPEDGNEQDELGIELLRNVFIDGFHANKNECQWINAKEELPDDDYNHIVQYWPAGLKLTPAIIISDRKKIEWLTNKYNKFDVVWLKESQHTTTLLIPCDSSGNPIINENTITGYKKC